MKVQEIMLKNKYLSSKSVIHDHKKLSDILEEEKWVDVPFEKIGNYTSATVKSNGKVVDINIKEAWPTSSQLLKITDSKYFPTTFNSNIMFSGKTLAVIYINAGDGTVNCRDINWDQNIRMSAHLTYFLIK